MDFEQQLARGHENERYKKTRIFQQKSGREHMIELLITEFKQGWMRKNGIRGV